MPVPAGIPLNDQTPETGVKPQWRDISARYLLNATRNSEAAKWAPWVRVVRARKNKPGEPTKYVIETITVHPNTPPNRSHFVTIKGRNPTYQGLLSKCPAIKINCDCENFVFYCEFALWYRGSAELLRCNGDYPVITNPNLRIKACKHAIHALARIVNQGI